MNAAPRGRRFLLRNCLPAAALLIAGCAAAPDAPVATVPAAGPDEFDVHREQAEMDSRTPEGQKYEHELIPAIGQPLADLLKKCTAEFPGAEESFELMFRIDRFGEPKAVLANPVTDLSECVAKGAWYFAYPRPDEKYTGLGIAVLVPIRIR